MSTISEPLQWLINPHLLVRILWRNHPWHLLVVQAVNWVHNRFPEDQPVDHSIPDETPTPVSSLSFENFPHDNR